jgi:CDP-glucose 4,6-dehydratase
VLEPLRGYLMLAESLWHRPDEVVGSWNFGPSDADTRSVAEVVARAVEFWGGSAKWHVAPAASLHEAMSLQLDCSKAHRMLRWRPLTDLETGLAWTIDWYRRLQNGDDARGLCREQIDRFLACDAAPRSG